MAITRSRSSWLISLSILLIAGLSYWGYLYISNKKRNDQISGDCRNKEWYKLPAVIFKDYQPITNENAMSVILKRKGQILNNDLKLKAVANSDRLIDFELSAKVADSTSIQKTDSIIITFRNEKHVISGFMSDSYEVDHGILQCLDSYQVDGKYYNDTKINRIYSTKK